MGSGELGVCWGVGVGRVEVRRWGLGVGRVGVGGLR